MAEERKSNPLAVNSSFTEMNDAEEQQLIMEEDNTIFRVLAPFGKLFMCETFKLLRL